jgi:hypothetical protein
MDDTTRNDIRKLLKNFGVLADEIITAHIERFPSHLPLHLRLTLEDLTDYGSSSPEESLHMEIEGEVRR